MESDALLEMVTGLWDRFHVETENVVTDDDSKMSSNCKWSNDNWMKHHGKTDVFLSIGTTRTGKKKKIKRTSGHLRYPISEPTFLADPAH
jgi:hypothetical protein